MKLALGVFDGVHIGHQKVIEKAHRVMTFDPHPNPGRHLLTTLKERQDLIGNLDVIRFNKWVSNLSPEDFVKKIILKRYKNLTTVIVGEDFAFGYNREGDTKTLLDLGKKHGFDVEIIPEITYQKEPVRSTEIRHFLGHGNLEMATKYLGRAYQLSGRIYRGSGTGHKLGFPTINIQPEDSNKLIPLEGVYKGEAIVNNQAYKAAIFIGTRKTFDGEHKVVEAHLLGFNQKVYGKRATVFFYEYLRNEKKFKDATALSKQIKRDVKLVKG